jgi:hypothetical protein
MDKKNNNGEKMIKENKNAKCPICKRFIKTIKGKDNSIVFQKHIGVGHFPYRGRGRGSGYKCISSFAPLDTNFKEWIEAQNRIVKILYKVENRYKLSLLEERA